MQYPEVVESVYKKISSIPQINHFPYTKDWILKVLYHRTINREAKYPLYGNIKSVVDFALEHAPIDDWNITPEDYENAKANQQNQWLVWRDSLTPVDSGMKKTIDDNREF